MSGTLPPASYPISIGPTFTGPTPRLLLANGTPESSENRPHPPTESIGEGPQARVQRCWRVTRYWAGPLGM